MKPFSRLRRWLRRRKYVKENSGYLVVVEYLENDGSVWETYTHFYKTEKDAFGYRALLYFDEPYVKNRRVEVYKVEPAV